MLLMPVYADANHSESGKHSELHHNSKVRRLSVSHHKAERRAMENLVKSWMC